MRLNVRDGWWQDEPPDLPEGAEPVGYAWMVRQRNLDVMPHHRWSFAARIGGRRSIEFQGLTWEIFPVSYKPDGVAEQLEFALKYDGVNLEILRAWFETLAVDEVERIEAWVRASPTSGYARRAWFLFEWLTGRELSLEDAPPAAYVPVLDPESYFVTEGVRSRRHRVLDNLLGSRDFCALVRRTPALDRFAELGLARRIEEILARPDADTLARVVSYLYTKETRSSFEIEREKPTTDRLRRFVEVLRGAHQWADLTDADLVRLQNLIVVDPRNRAAAWRECQNYVGGPGPRDIAFVTPRPVDLPPMMTAWLRMVARAVASDLDPVVAAAAVAFTFVYLHPFEDGNGRIHRFLVHYVLARKHFSPPGFLLPVSATMLAHMREYDDALERFSVPLMTRLRYELSDEYFTVEVLHDSSGYYRYPDLTVQAEALYGWVECTIEDEVPREVAFLLAYREARRGIAEIVELPDRVAEHFVARCLENRGRLSKGRRRKDFDALTDAEIRAMEDAVRAAMAAQGMEVGP
jgi:hypothetical protein